MFVGDPRVSPSVSANAISGRFYSAITQENLTWIRHGLASCKRGYKYIQILRT